MFAMFGISTTILPPCTRHVFYPTHRSIPAVKSGSVSTALFILLTAIGLINECPMFPEGDPVVRAVSHLSALPLPLLLSLHFAILQSRH